MSAIPYTHGHHPSVVGVHATRTIENSATYLEPWLAEGKSLLDVGCGPGSITSEFAERLGPGKVVGVDASYGVIETAQSTNGETGAEFSVMDLFNLDLPDDSFDIVHAHQVLQHVGDPLAALAEMRRVAKPGGVVAVRDADYPAMHWTPDSWSLHRWLEIYQAVAVANGANPDAGRRLLGWAQESGFSAIEPTSSTWLFAIPESRMWWAKSWARRLTESALTDQAVNRGLASESELEEIAAGWLAWAEQPNGWFVVPHGELVCTV